MAWSRSAWGFLLAGLVAACGSDKGPGPIGEAKQASNDPNGDTISATPNPCIPNVGAQTCSTTVSWTEANNTTLMYQVAVQQDNGPWKLFACIPPNNSLRSLVATLIAPTSTYRFSLRKGASTCAFIDAAATQAWNPDDYPAVVTVNASTAWIAASPSLVVTSSTGSTNITWRATQIHGHDKNGVYKPLDVAVWAYVPEEQISSQTAQPPTSPYGLFNCTVPDPVTGVPGSQAAPWIVPGKSYRFTLNLTPNGCVNLPTAVPDCYTQPRGPKCVPDGPEIASVTVKGVSSYITASPDRCSIPSGATCTTELSYGTSVTSGVAQVWSFDGTTWTKLPNCPPTWSDLHRTLTSGKTYTYELYKPSSCSAARTGTPLATTKASALTDYVVRYGTILALNGPLFRSIGANKSDLFLQYISYPGDICGGAGGAGGVCALACDDGTTGHPTIGHESQANAAMDDAAAHGMEYLRVFGLGFYKEDMRLWWPGCGGTNPPCAPGTSWCTNAYFNKYDAMMQHAAAAQVQHSNGTVTTGLKLVLMPAGVTQFPTLAAGQNLTGDSQNMSIASMLNVTKTCSELLATYPNPTPGVPSSLPPDSTASDVRKRGMTAKLLLCRHVKDVVTRYSAGGAHPEYATTVQMWELPQELYGYTDYDFDHDAQQLPDITVEQAAWFMRDLAASIKGWDPKHLVDSGDGSPRPFAAHNRARAGNGGKALYPYDLDDENMMASFVDFISADPVDVVSYHYYDFPYTDVQPLVPNDYNSGLYGWGYKGRYNAQMLGAYKRAADRIGKPMYVGEFNDGWGCTAGTSGTCNNGASCTDTDGCSDGSDCRCGVGLVKNDRWNFARATVQEIANLHIPLSSAWGFEYDYPYPSQFKFCPPNPVAGSSCAGAGNTPGSDLYVGFTKNVQKAFDFTANTMDLSPPNFAFEENPSGTPNHWSPSGSGTTSVVSNPQSMGPFSANYLRLQPAAGAVVGVVSEPIYLGMPVPPGARLIATTAGRTSASPAPTYQSVQVWGYDANGNGTCIFGGPNACLYTDLINDGESDPGHFRVRLGRSPSDVSVKSVTVPATTRYFKVALYSQGPAGSYVDFDDVRILMVY